MKTDDGDKFLARVTCVTRGLLAVDSGSEDDPFSRVILKCGEGRAEGGLPVEVPAGTASVDDVRQQVGAILRTYTEQKGYAPSVISLAGLGARRVEKEDASPAFPLRNKVAIVTGAAGAIGAGICRGLLEKGCHVAAMDVVQDRLDELVGEFKAGFGDRVIGVQSDVTDVDSVRRGFEKVILSWGGVDLVVVNAGIAHVAPLMELDLETFRKLERVNVEGTLLTMAEAGRCMVNQGTGGDIVLVSSKNVFAPGAQFGAYSATKAASHQLARIASLEYAPHGIRVNMVSPDAVFSDGKRKSGLWAEVGPSRMKARGLDEKGLEDYYRNRNLLKSRVTPAHVANAVLFFATRQTPTTGATLPVDGGVPEAAPR